MYFLSQAMDPTRRATGPYRRISRAAGSAAAAGRTYGTKVSWKWGGATVAKYCRLHGGKSTGRYKGVSTNLVPTIFCYQREKTKDWEVVRRASAAPPDDEPFPPPLLSKSPSFSQSCGGSRPWSKKGNLQRTLDTNKSGCCALLLLGAGGFILTSEYFCSTQRVGFLLALGLVVSEQGKRKGALGKTTRGLLAARSDSVRQQDPIAWRGITPTLVAPSTATRKKIGRGKAREDYGTPCLLLNRPC